MKFNIEVDTTPEKVRRLMGLPDLSEVHEVYLDKLKKVADKGLTPDMVQGMIRNWVPMGDQSMDFIKSLMGGLAGGGDTIFALSSGAPPAAIAVVRISGAQAFKAVRLLTGTLPPPRKAALRNLKSPASGELLDQGLVLIFSGPATATG